MRLRLPIPLAPFVLLLVSGVPAHAQWEAGRDYWFEATTNDNPANVAAGERQLWAHVFPQPNTTQYIEMYVFADGGEPPFEPLSITEVVIDDRIGLFANFGVVIEPPNDDSLAFDRIVDPMRPGDLIFRADPRDPVYHGAGPEDAPLILLLQYYPDLNIAGITGLELLFAALDGNPTVGKVPVMLKVEGFADGGTEYFELVSPIATPEPSAGGPAAALAALAMLRRRRGRAPANARRALPSLRS